MNESPRISNGHRADSVGEEPLNGNVSEEINPLNAISDIAKSLQRVDDL